MGYLFAKAALVDTIENILFLRSNKQMLWIDAAWIVAAMQNAERAGYRPIVQFIRDNVRSTQLAGDPNSTISAAIFRGAPLPAAGFQNTMFAVDRSRGGVSSHLLTPRGSKPITPSRSSSSTSRPRASRRSACRCVRPMLCSVVDDFPAAVPTICVQHAIRELDAQAAIGFLHAPGAAFRAGGLVVTPALKAGADDDPVLSQQVDGHPPAPGCIGTTPPLALRCSRTVRHLKKNAAGSLGFSDSQAVIAASTATSPCSRLALPRSDRFPSPMIAKPRSQRALTGSSAGAPAPDPLGSEFFLTVLSSPLLSSVPEPSCPGLVPGNSPFCAGRVPRILSAFVPLHLAQSVWRFSMTVAPPFEAGMT